MNSQNRMNAGAEYVLYRLWAALQDGNGIHAESLLTCVGALAGYACQACVRQTAALPGADPQKYVLRTVAAADGTPYLNGDALNVPLIESPLSVWALVSRTLRKLDQPVPDIEDILRHVTQTMGTSAFGVPRIPDDEPRPRQAALAYLKQVWPQILPIAQRFCSKPAQLPVLFGIALQRAIEQTQDALSPTRGASIAMECAVAMSKVALPEVASAPAITELAAVSTAMNATPMPLHMASPSRAKVARATPVRTAPARKRRSASSADERPRGIGALVASIPPAARVVTITSLAFIAVAGVLFRADRIEPQTTALEERQQDVPKLRVGMFTPEQPMQEAEASQEMPASEESPPPEQEVSAPSEPPEQPAENVVNQESERPLDSLADGSAEMLMSAGPAE